MDYKVVITSDAEIDLDEHIQYLLSMPLKKTPSS